MKAGVVKALLKKDIALFMSNRFYLLITVLGLVFYAGIYFIMPSTTDETLDLAMYAPVVPPAVGQIAAAEGIELEFFDSEEELKQAVLDGDYQVAIALPADIMEVWVEGGKPEITVYYASTASSEVSDVVVALVKEIAYMQTGQTLSYDTTEEILGPDMLGAQIALRDRMRPLLAIFILLLEILTLASLIMVEIEQGTARALLVTPMGVSDLFVAKGVLGVGLALAQAVLFMALVGGFSNQPLIILTTLFIGSLMAVGIGFLVASFARDVMAVTGWGMLILIILAIPGFGTVVPGLLSDWTRVIPSYYLTDTVSRVVNYGAGWGDVGVNLAILAAFTAAVFWAGIVILRRRYQ